LSQIKKFSIKNLMNKFNFTIVVPFYNEGLNISKTYEEILYYLSNKEIYEYEIIFVNDASNDNSNLYFNQLKGIENLTILKNEINSGQSLSILKAVKISKYDIIVTLDGDCQNNPKDIPKLIEIYYNNDYSLVGGIRLNRKDNLIKKISSKLANKIRNFILKDECIDTGCSLKIFDKKIFLILPFFKGIHRFLPALFKGYNKKTFFVNVQHRPRKHGNSKYGTFNRLFIGVIDLIRVVNIINKFKREIND